MLVLAVIATLSLVAAAFSAVGSHAIDHANRQEIGGRDRFVAAFGRRHRFPAALLAQTYDILSRRTTPPVRDLRPADRLDLTLGMSAADVEDVALLVAARCEGRIPTARDLDELDAHVRTVHDLVGFLVPFCAPAPARRAARG